MKNDTINKILVYSTVFFMIITCLLAFVAFSFFLELKTIKMVIPTCPSFSSKAAMEKSFLEGNKKLDGNKDGIPCDNYSYQN